LGCSETAVQRSIARLYASIASPWMDQSVTSTPSSASADTPLWLKVVSAAHGSFDLKLCTAPWTPGSIRRRVIAAMSSAPGQTVQG